MKASQSDNFLNINVKNNVTTIHLKITFIILHQILMLKLNKQGMRQKSI
jgi:hypothetical protein